ncbi:hypothetical protein F4777DRAFT_564551 [Nemania sp. FL0916]|nr:hypothetical protein F4777DRAFT_564551 [Nemania sp. FL0916]
MCTQANPRKDNHTRHVATCRKPPNLDWYLCLCGESAADKAAHIEHVKCCGFSFNSTAAADGFHTS